ncbi:Glu/Leu/Phe/Val dehydrogenase dimerization domain-containing protein [Nocardioides sp. LHD-245]|uniref:Glu/Leu/Phe/Val dehydrogenase dimerization domain-containing protein n=1 Tax=Nocardioides sp. LHD-245 TaxID=3051387 RepID=UPI0027DEC2FD|nr:Glu/Leu/Phe/Val dehydrogenase dimerization domain-containing protein [Nocardioides sp. LHD-245]
MTLTAAPADLVFERSDELGTAGHEQVVFCRDAASGLRAIIAIHDTRLGPALGGTRFYPYASEAEALTDVLRLSQGMTHKAAAAGIALGGGKAVIIGDPATVKTPALLAAYGRFVDTLSGRYITAGDVGTSAQDLDIVATATRHVVGSTGGSGDSGYSTAYGVFSAMRAAAEHRWGPDGLRGRRVGVEGVGKVGAQLVGLLLEEGAEVTVSDASGDALAQVLERHPRITIRHAVLDAPVDVYAPCALGATLTTGSADAIRASIVCGAANNQLLDSSVAPLLRRRDITWVPDYVANAGGLIQVGGEIGERTTDDVRGDIARIADTVRDILRRSDEGGLLPGEVAAEIVAERLAAAPSRPSEGVRA